jgi:hypothetical protein
MRSRGGALHTRPDEKMGYENPVTFYIEAKGHPRIMKMLKRHAKKKRRQRDKTETKE